jgi:hypothetical protein
MMEYVLLAYRDEKRWEAMSANERAAFEEACQASEQDLIHSLHLVDIKSLQNNTALTVRIVNGQVSLADGPVPGSQEQLIQLLFIRARDLNAAIQIASKMPQARAGPIEVRPVVGYMALRRRRSHYSVY